MEVMSEIVGFPRHKS